MVVCAVVNTTSVAVAIVMRSSFAERSAALNVTCRRALPFLSTFSCVDMSFSVLLAAVSRFFASFKSWRDSRALSSERCCFARVHWSSTVVSAKSLSMRVRFFGASSKSRWCCSAAAFASLASLYLALMRCLLILPLPGGSGGDVGRRPRRPHLEPPEVCLLPRLGTVGGVSSSSGV